MRVVDCVFFFSSRRRHTRFDCDWSSDVCSSDLVGITMNAFTGDQLKALGVQESYDVAAFTPGVHISGNLAGQNTQFTIRGVTQNDFNDIVEAPNAVYLDEGYIAIAQAQTFALYDIDRV